jgi:uncharacterized protein (TIGR00375 family)
MQVNADLHIHGRYSIGVSKYMTPENLALGSKRKGIQLLGTGDCLHQDWLKGFEDLERIDDGTYAFGDIRFVLTAEVQDSSRVHHVLMFPSHGSASEFRRKVAKHSNNIDKDGRPILHLSGVEIAQFAKDVDALIGPSHAFTPWTSLYAYFDGLQGSYGDMMNYVSFIELGLSADSDYADRIEELENVTFLTNSDAHSHHPQKLAREFTRFEMDEMTFEGLRRALLRKGHSGAVLNVGLPPQEGKYNETACTRCYTHYSLKDAMARKWRCTCKGRIKKGVLDRVGELADFGKPRHPEHRPKYLHLIPLSEIIARALGMASVSSKKVKGVWEKLVDRFGSEVAALVDADMDEIEDAVGADTARAIRLFRENRIMVLPGGGGQYGKIFIPGFGGFDERDFEALLKAQRIRNQKGLDDF